MIRIAPKDLPPPTGRALRALQERVNGAGRFPTQVTEGLRLFAARNRPTDSVFRVVRANLLDLPTGPWRCGYCEDSGADEVEHIWPKSHFPNRVFDWTNYLMACGPCNGPKRNEFELRHRNGSKSPLEWRQGGRIPRKPAMGSPMLIDPRVDDPIEFLHLDLVDTFFFAPRAELNANDRERAVYTLAVLRLNERPMLPWARGQAFRNYRARLREYVTDKRAGAATGDLARARDAMLTMGHQTVWREMVRQRAHVPGLEALFVDAPEATTWT